MSHDFSVIIYYCFSDVDTSGSVVTDSTSAILEGLEPWSNYSVSVAASTKAGEGVTSHPIICTTLEDGEHSKIHIFFLF